MNFQAFNTSQPKQQPNIIRYIVPQDFDQVEHPNAYESNAYTLKQIKESFPLSGDYIFRFLCMREKNNKPVFIDFIEKYPHEGVPEFEGGIFIKATRIDKDKPIRYRERGLFY